MITVCFEAVVTADAILSGLILVRALQHVLPPRAAPLALSLGAEQE